MKIRAIHSLFSAVSRKPTTCFSSWRTQWSLLSCGRTVSLRKKSSCCLQKPPQSNQVKWEEKMWIETSCRIAASTRLRRVDVGRNQCCHLCSDEQRLLEASMACMDGSEIVCEGPRCSLGSKKESNVVIKQSWGTNTHYSKH
ncbi:unnamed protein product [Brassica oleracea]